LEPLPHVGSGRGNGLHRCLECGAHKEVHLHRARQRPDHFRSHGVHAVIEAVGQPHIAGATGLHRLGGEGVTHAFVLAVGLLALEGEMPATLDFEAVAPRLAQQLLRRLHEQRLSANCSGCCRRRRFCCAVVAAGTALTAGFVVSGRCNRHGAAGVGADAGLWRWQKRPCRLELPDFAVWSLHGINGRFDRDYHTISLDSSCLAFEPFTPSEK
ncbi:unnamed protein product, partial [Phaeothamnion confervicola]